MFSLQNNNAGRLNSDGIKGIIRELLRPVLVLIISLLSAGKFDWSNAWGFSGLLLCLQLVYVVMLIRLNPQLLNYRGGTQKNTKWFDRVFFVLYALATISTLIISGFDAVRYRWSEMPVEGSLMGGVLCMLSFAFVLWAMAVNTHFEGTARIQQERNHKVCTSGPYKIVRHPGYTGMILGVLSIPLILGSWWGCVPACVAAFLIFVRTILEDRMLRRELPGYKEYTSSTRYRLLPHVW